MKKVIRLTESDLTRIVKRIILESSEKPEWTNQDREKLSHLQNKLEELQNQWMDKYGHLDVDDRIEHMNSNDPIFRNIENTKKQTSALYDKLNSVKNWEDDERYSNVVKNRPSDFDADIYNDLYLTHTDKINSLSPKVPKYSDYGSEREDEWYDDYSSSSAKNKIDKISKSRDYYRDHLGKDLKRRY